MQRLKSILALMTNLPFMMLQRMDERCFSHLAIGYLWLCSVFFFFNFLDQQELPNVDLDPNLLRVLSFFLLSETFDI